MFDKVCLYLKQRNIHVSAEERTFIQSHTKLRVITKHTIIMQQGKPVSRLFFLNKGIVRLYREHDGEDYTLGIISTNDFVSTPLYLQTQEPSPCALETLTDVEVLEWNLFDLIAIKKTVEKAHTIEMMVMDRLLNWLQQIQMDSVCLTAEERYRKLVEEQPELIHNIPLKYIASFLAIHQDSLSRIRKSTLQKAV